MSSDLMTDKIELDEKALEATARAIAGAAWQGHELAVAQRAITAYLSATAQQPAKADPGEERLRAILASEYRRQLQGETALEVESGFRTYAICAALNAMRRVSTATSHPASESVKALATELRKLEWAKDPEGYGYWCRACGRSKDDAHHADCTLAAALALLQPQEKQG